MGHLQFYFRLLYFSSFLILFSECGTLKNHEDPFVLSPYAPFTIETAYAQSWLAGTSEGGSGTNLYITIENMEEGVVIHVVYFRNKTKVLTTSLKNPGLFIAYFEDKKREDVIMSIDPNAEAQNRPLQINPFHLLDNEAVIGYSLNNKENYFKITEIVEKPLIAYPGSKPPDDEFPDN